MGSQRSVVYFSAKTKINPGTKYLKDLLKSTYHISESDPGPRSPLPIWFSFYFTNSPNCLETSFNNSSSYCSPVARMTHIPLSNIEDIFRRALWRHLKLEICWGRTCMKWTKKYVKN